jgi:hypothetical protein
MKTKTSLTLFTVAMLAALATQTSMRAAEPVTNAITKPVDTPADAQDLSSQATDPTASLMAFNFKGLWSDFHGPDVPGESTERWQFQFQPVIPFEAFGHPNIFRATIPYQLGGRGDEGFSQISIFDLVVFNQEWGRWGAGPVMSLDTTGDAPDRFVIGPAIGGVWRVNKKLNVGLFNQNVFWSDTASSQVYWRLNGVYYRPASVSHGPEQGRSARG